MPSSTSNFKRILRLPRLFFRQPTVAESVHGGPPLEFERPIPQIPWRGITVVVVVVVIAAACAWEFYCRSIGYGPTLNDNEDLWTINRQRIKPESVVIIGDSRGWYDLDLDELQKGLGKRPVQLAMGGGCAYPVRERRARMTEECARPGSGLQKRIQQIWLPLFTPPPPPSYIPTDVFMAKMKDAIEKRARDTIAAVEKLRGRGGKVVFVRLPVSGGLKALEDKTTPRNQTWDPLLKGTGTPGIYFEDFPELAGFNCPEWSHLSAGDSVEFSKRLVPHLRAALGM